MPFQTCKFHTPKASAMARTHHLSWFASPFIFIPISNYLRLFVVVVDAVVLLLLVACCCCFFFFFRCACCWCDTDMSQLLFMSPSALSTTRTWCFQHRVGQRNSAKSIGPGLFQPTNLGTKSEERAHMSAQKRFSCHFCNNAFLLVKTL